MKKLRLWAGLAMLFCSGIVVGSISTWIVAEHRALENITRERPHIPKIILKKLDRKLDLNDSQRKRVEEIVCQTYLELMDLRERNRPEKHEILQRGMAAIRVELSPEQQKKFDEIHARLEADRARKDLARRTRAGEGKPCE